MLLERSSWFEKLKTTASPANSVSIQKLFFLPLVALTLSPGAHADGLDADIFVNLQVPTYFPQIVSYEEGGCSNYGINRTCNASTAGIDANSPAWCVISPVSGGGYTSDCVYNVIEIDVNGVSYLIDPGDPANVTTAQFAECVVGECFSPPPGPPGVLAGVIVEEIDSEILPSIEFTSDDNDGDVYPFTMDNCPFVANSDQADSDGDGIGDACDNCPTTSSNNVNNNDGDVFGDICDLDDDNDGIDDVDANGNPLDNCPLVANEGQGDVDSDGIGDLCDEDRDNDGLPNLVDNCPSVSNPLQENRDEHLDRVGDACDTNYDNDSFEDGDDKTVRFYSYSNSDDDADGIGDAADNCLSESNVDQMDEDGNGIGDLCEQSSEESL